MNRKVSGKSKKNLNYLMDDSGLSANRLQTLDDIEPMDISTTVSYKNATLLFLIESSSDNKEKRIGPKNTNGCFNESTTLFWWISAENTNGYFNESTILFWWISAKNANGFPSRERNFSWNLL